MNRWIPSRWTWKLALPLAAVVFGIAAGTGAYAMRGDDGSDRTAQADQNASLGERQENGEDGSLAICIEGATDCADTPLGDDPCPEGGCTAFPAPCPPDSACIEPWLMDPPTCPEDVPAEECKRLIEEGGYYECVTLESDPPQTRCVVVQPCYSGDGPVTTLPAPLEEGSEEGEAIDPADDRDSLVDPLPCASVDECGPNAGAPGAVDGENARCLPPDCAVSSDGAVACPEPCVVGPAVDCVPPVECAVSSDGSTFCPEPCVAGPAVDCGPPVDCTVADDGSVSCPGSPPTVDNCSDPDSLVRCVDPSPGTSGGGSSGSTGSGEPIERQ